MTDTLALSRRDAIALIAAATTLAPLPGLESSVKAGERTLALTCFIRYQIDPFQREAFKAYAEKWGEIIPRCGGHLIGYFLPLEGTNDIGWGLISFESLAAYETYRARLRADPEAIKNFGIATAKKFVLREERTFLENVEGTINVAPHP